MKGKFIVLDGCDFAGKTTQIKKISEYLSGKNIKHIITREPGGTEIGENIRHLVLHNTSKLTPNAELLIFTALRSQHIQTKIKPLIEDGVFIICDRFLASTFVYQGILRGIEKDIISYTHSTFVENIQPDATFILDVDPNISFNRMKLTCKTQHNIYDSTDVEEIEKIRNGFLEFTKLYPCHIINANQDSDTVFYDIKNIIEKLL